MKANQQSTRNRGAPGRGTRIECPQGAAVRYVRWFWCMRQTACIWKSCVALCNWDLKWEFLGEELAHTMTRSGICFDHRWKAGAKHSLKTGPSESNYIFSGFWTASIRRHGDTKKGVVAQGPWIEHIIPLIERDERRNQERNHPRCTATLCSTAGRAFAWARKQQAYQKT